MRFIKSLRRWFKEDSAATATEYAVMLALIIAVVLLSIGSTGSGVLSWWTNINTDFGTHGF
jgi:Flp pilus assembly pilin Flp